MTDLPVCRLCKCVPVYSESFNKHSCQNECAMKFLWLTEKEWQKLMYVPARKEIPAFVRDRQVTHDIGYNAAIDDMERGEP